MRGLAQLDQFFTPPEAARALIDLLPNSHEVKTVIDPACGTGNLLLSARERWPQARARGLDIDKGVVANLRKAHSAFDLAVGSLYPKICVSREWMTRTDHDLVLINPPFSMESRRYVDVDFGGTRFRAGLAMAHIAAALTHLQPRLGLLAVVPESALHSELDAELRLHLEASMQLVVGGEISCNAFRGARVRSVLCGWFPRPNNSDIYGIQRSSQERPSSSISYLDLAVEISRGNLPVFRARRKRSGLRFIHSTHLSGIRHDRDIPVFRVAPHGAGCTAGNVVLLSRVGSPRQDHVIAVKLREEVQLSDCVIALATRSWNDALKIRKIIRTNWESFKYLYRGTGAPFITMRRLTEWLSCNGVSVSFDSGHKNEGTENSWKRS